MTRLMFPCRCDARREGSGGEQRFAECKRVGGHSFDAGRERMYHGAQDGWIEVVSGVMFSGKSEELLRRVRRAVIARKRVQVFKSHLDDRYGLFTVSSHDGTQIDAHPVSNSVQVAELVKLRSQVVAIDEAQFMDDGIVHVVNRLADEGIRVIVAGTDMDFRGEPFGPIPRLLAVAERIDKLHAICVVCGDLATRNQRLIDGEPAPAEGPTIHVGGSESYEARCRRCHDVPLRDRSQTRMEMEPGLGRI
jgi:thymidine kinase